MLASIKNIWGHDVTSERHLNDLKFERERERFKRFGELLRKVYRWSYAFDIGKNAQGAEARKFAPVLLMKYIFYFIFKCVNVLKDTSCKSCKYLHGLSFYISNCVLYK